MIDLIPIPTLKDAADILFLTVVTYQLYIWFSETRALRVLIGLALLGGIFSLAKLWGLFLTTYVFQVFWQVLLILLLILFQSEIKQVLEKVSPLRYLRTRKNAIQGAFTKDLVKIVFEMADEGTGALIVIAGENNPEEFIHSGHTIMAIPEPLLIKSIFNKHSPFHDGAVFISNDRIVKVGGILPLSEQDNIPKKYGTRHRAALGLSELIDSLCIVVSEERSEVVTVQNGKIKIWSEPESLAVQLRQWLGVPDTAAPMFKDIFKEVFVRKWKPKFIAFTIVLLAWIVLAGQQEVAQNINAPLRIINQPSGMVIDKTSVKSVHLKLAGKRSTMNSLKAQDVHIQLDLTGMAEGEHILQLTAKNVDLPIGIKIKNVTPDAVKFLLTAPGRDRETH